MLGTSQKKICLVCDFVQISGLRIRRVFTRDRRPEIHENIPTKTAKDRWAESSTARLVSGTEWGRNPATERVCLVTRNPWKER